jgi:hypothetical protein
MTNFVEHVARKHHYKLQVQPPPTPHTQPKPPYTSLSPRVPSIITSISYCLIPCAINSRGQAFAIRSTD